MKVLSNLFGTDKKISANSVAYKKDNKGITLDTELDNLESSKQDVLVVEKLSASDFFDTYNVSFLDFYVYKYGNIINIQRFSHTNVTVSASVSYEVGYIKEKYRPVSGKTMRIGFQNESNIAVPTRGYIDSDVGRITYGSTGTSYKTSGFIWNTTYICKGE